MPKKAEILRVRRFTDDTLVGLMKDAETGRETDFYAEVSGKGLAQLAEGDRVVYGIDAHTKGTQVLRILTPKANEITLEHRITGRQVDLKLGFSWSTLLLAPFFGAPLLKRGLTKPALFVSSLFVAHIFVVQGSPMVMSHGRSLHEVGGVALAPEVFSLLTGVMICLELATCMFLAGHANRWQALDLVRRGYLLHGATSESKISLFHAYIGATARSKGYGPKVEADTTPASAGTTQATIPRSRLQSMFAAEKTLAP